LWKCIPAKGLESIFLTKIRVKQRESSMFINFNIFVLFYVSFMVSLHFDLNGASRVDVTTTMTPGPP